MNVSDEMIIGLAGIFGAVTVVMLIAVGLYLIALFFNWVFRIDVLAELDKLLTQLGL